MLTARQLLHKVLVIVVLVVVEVVVVIMVTVRLLFDLKFTDSCNNIHKIK